MSIEKQKQESNELKEFISFTKKIKNSTSLYQIFDISQNASIEKLKKARAKLLLKWHPDKCHDSLKKDCNILFQFINNSYKKLLRQQT